MKVKNNIIAALMITGILLTGCSSNEYNGIKYNLKEDGTLIKNNDLYLSLYKNTDDVMKFLVEEDLLPKTQTEFRLSGPDDKVTVRVSKGLVNKELTYKVSNPQIKKDTGNEDLLNTYYKVNDKKLEKVDLETVNVYGFDGNEDGKFDDTLYDIAPKTSDENKDVVEEKDSKDSSYNIKYGELLSVNINEDILVIKAKIKPNLNNKLTISQNGFNVEDIIKSQGGDQFNEIQYWAVADMTDGSESKVISFTLNKDLIDSVKSGNTPANQIIDKAADVWILPSLQN